MFEYEFGEVERVILDWAARMQALYGSSKTGAGLGGHFLWLSSDNLGGFFYPNAIPAFHARWRAAISQSGAV